jgi:predicted acyltransferase
LVIPFCYTLIVMTTVENPSIEFAPKIPSTLEAPRSSRLLSLDVFRGITIAAMVLVNQQPDPKYWPLEHVAWHGWTPTDLIFPFFLFIVGVATPFSMAKRIALGETRKNLLGHIWTRALALFTLGQLLQGLPYSGLAPAPTDHAWIFALRIAAWTFCCLGVVLILVPWKSVKFTAILTGSFLVLFYVFAFVVHKVAQNTHGLPEHFGWGNGLLSPLHFRIPGVLQRIGICYGIAATIGLFFGWRMILVWTIAFFAIYSGLMLKMPFSNHKTGSLTKEDNLSRRIDETLLIREGHWNHAYGPYPDNEGALSTIPAIGSVLIGIVVGFWLRSARPVAERGAGVLVFGLFVLLLGLGLNQWLMPINKNIWTPSFTVFTAGMGMLCLGTLFYFVDVLDYRRWALPFKIYGMNAIAAFVLSGLLVRIAIIVKTKTLADNGRPMSLWSAYQHTVIDAVKHVPHIGTAENASLIFALSYVVVILLIMSVLYAAKIFVKV